MCDETCGDAGGVLRGLDGDGEDDQGGAVVEKRLGLKNGAAVGVDAAPQAGDGGGVGGAEAGADEESGSHAQPREDADEGDEGGRDGDKDRGAEDDAAQASPHAVEGDRQRLPVQEDRQEDREDHRAGQGHLLPHREQRDSHAGGDEKYRGDEAEPVGDRVGDNRSADKGDDHLDGHGAGGFPSWDECGGLTAAGPGEGRSQRAWGQVRVRPRPG